MVVIFVMSLFAVKTWKAVVYDCYGEQETMDGSGIATHRFAFFLNRLKREMMVYVFFMLNMSSKRRGRRRANEREIYKSCAEHLKAREWGRRPLRQK